MEKCSQVQSPASGIQHGGVRKKKKTKTIYQIYFHANEIFAFIGHMRPMEQFLFSI